MCIPSLAQRVRGEGGNSTKCLQRVIATDKTSEDSKYYDMYYVTVLVSQLIR
jgi:hypothetical protein